MANTNKLEEFGFIELQEAALLLTEYVNTKNNVELGSGVKLEFNQDSGKVFLTDEDCNVAVLEDGDLVNFYWCSECGYEGTKSDYEFDKKNGNTQECCKKCFEGGDEE